MIYGHFIATSQVEIQDKKGVITRFLILMDCAKGQFHRYMLAISGFLMHLIKVSHIRVFD